MPSRGPECGASPLEPIPEKRDRYPGPHVDTVEAERTGAAILHANELILIRASPAWINVDGGRNRTIEPVEQKKTAGGRIASHGCTTVPGSPLSRASMSALTLARYSRR